MSVRLRRSVLIALLAVGSCASKSDRKAHKEALKDPWSDASLQEHAKLLMPMVEEAAGGKFTEPPPVKWIDEEPFAALVAQETRVILDIVYAETAPEVRERIADQQRGIGGLLGKYATPDDSVYLNKDTLRAVMMSEGLDLDAPEGVIQLVLAHELTHALQDDMAPFDDVFPKLRDLEHMEAWGAVDEGQAVWVCEQVAEELGLTELNWAILKGQGWGEQGLIEPAAFPIFARYGQGRTFVRALEAKQDKDAVWEALRSPPAHTGFIFAPDTYPAANPPPEVDYAAALRGSLDKLTSGDWAMANTWTRDASLRKYAVYADAEEDLAVLLQHLVHGQSVIGERPGRSADVTVLVFDTQQAAAGYAELLRRQERAMSAQLAEASGLAVEVVFESLEEIEGDDVGIRVERVPIGGGAHLERRVAWVLRGSDLVLVRTERFRPGLRLQWAIEHVFEQLAAQRSASK